MQTIIQLIRAGVLVRPQKGMWGARSVTRHRVVTSLELLAHMWKKQQIKRAQIKIAHCYILENEQEQEHKKAFQAHNIRYTASGLAAWTGGWLGNSGWCVVGTYACCSSRCPSFHVWTIPSPNPTPNPLLTRRSSLPFFNLDTRPPPPPPLFSCGPNAASLVSGETAPYASLHNHTTIPLLLSRPRS